MACTKLIGVRVEPGPACPSTSPATMQLLEVMVGFGIAGTGFGVILAVVGRAASDENRSLALGIANGIRDALITGVTADNGVTNTAVGGAGK